MSDAPKIESGWNFEQGDLALFGVKDGEFWLRIGHKHPDEDEIDKRPGNNYYCFDIPLKEAAGFARRILRTLELAGYEEAPASVVQPKTNCLGTNVKGMTNYDKCY